MTLAVSKRVEFAPRIRECSVAVLSHTVQTSKAVAPQQSHSLTGLIADPNERQLVMNIQLWTLSMLPFEFLTGT